MKQIKKIKIHHFGPILDADINLKRINLIIGLQSSGKSCAMMIACFCSWVEKRIILRQSAKEFENSSYFIDSLISYYNVKEYLYDDTRIEYHSDFMSFQYSHETRQFSHKWERKRWSYERPKISYIPAERGIVSLISNWNKLGTQYDRILDFKQDWDLARSYMRKEANILQTGISYKYNEEKNLDFIITPNGNEIALTNSSSGIQSLIPQYLLLDYLCNEITKADKESLKEKSFSDKQLSINLLNAIYKRICSENIGEPQTEHIVHLEGKDFLFWDPESAEKFQKEAGKLLNTHHADIFLEEPECNLFPPTQFQLMNWIVELANKKNTFFLATHSPYILNHLLQENRKDFNLFLTYPANNGLFNIKTATEEEIQTIYDNGSDAFFNFEAFTT